ncbi:uncharacterized protein LOC124434371 [Xenia sp. Carnegie-2017]|uniref:uncharacterized protein LOC124434371 n=1 Tax=Xenia sp. Carnegie-2017 TaxID=2897299 RepID=UPI001F04FB3D|nr:uncharacterized protein LOC124434371 [Xenia sp. Carnegie-2017]XP_046840217.1 uncharacterized protein LOC124434371 [Xenia sp. Carnegie-2017]
MMLMMKMMTSLMILSVSMVEVINPSKDYDDYEKTCDYEKVIYSDGAHTTENGCMMVYFEEEPFSCPNCDSSNETVNVEVNQQTVAENRAIEYDKGNDKPKPDLGEKSLGNTYKLGKKQKKKRSSIEKSMDAVLEQFRAMSNDDFERYKKLEEFKLEKSESTISNQPSDRGFIHNASFDDC